MPHDPERIAEVRVEPALRKAAQNDRRLELQLRLP